MATEADLLPRSGWLNHSEQTGKDAKRAGAWSIETTLVSGVVVRSFQRIPDDSCYVLSLFELQEHSVRFCLGYFYDPTEARRWHYRIVKDICEVGKASYLESVRRR